ncbi:hypothetical protein BJV78DRAFT_1158061 [Lactifluus subvellereus]|nr:hypothetical protein BJV78DRAFT_1158061 [Lactifluus subvellereus]
MTRGNDSAPMDTLAWLSSVRVGKRTHEGTSGTGSGPGSRNASRKGSRSWPSYETQSTQARKTVEFGRTTSVVTGLQQESSRTKLERHDLVNLKKRTCTLSLNVTLRSVILGVRSCFLSYTLATGLLCYDAYACCVKFAVHV